MAAAVPAGDAEKPTSPFRMRRLNLIVARYLNRVPRRAWRWIIRLAVVAFVLPIVLQWLIAYIVGGDIRLLPIELQNAQSVLVVTAHPDDECLFFSPTILRVLSGNLKTRGSLLSISNGNNEGIGELRREELKGSCDALGINTVRCVALDHPELQDNPKVWWDTDLIQKLIAEHVKKWNIDAIITFDSGGVSGHINHRAVSAAVQAYASDPAAPAAYMVTTTMLLRKYTFLGDLPLTTLPFTWRIITAIFFPARARAGASAAADQGYGAKGLVANSWYRYMKTREAFRSHNSQYSWDRHLYMVLSRYVWFNDLVAVPKQVK